MTPSDDPPVVVLVALRVVPSAAVASVRMLVLKLALKLAVLVLRV